MALKPHVEVSETDSRTYNLIKELIKTCYQDERVAGIYLARRIASKDSTGKKASEFIGYRAAIVCTEPEPEYALEPVTADSRSEALRLLLEAVEVDMEKTLQRPEPNGDFERLDTDPVLENANDAHKPIKAAQKDRKRTKMGKKSVGKKKKDEEAVSEEEDELDHDLREAHVPKVRRGAVTRSKAPEINLSDSGAEEPVLEQRNLRSSTKSGKGKRKREESVDESDQETEDDNIVAVPKRAGKQALRMSVETGVKRGGKRGGREGGRGK